MIYNITRRIINNDLVIKFYTADDCCMEYDLCDDTTFFYKVNNKHFCYCLFCTRKLREVRTIKLALRRWIYRHRRRKAAARVIQTAFREAYYNPEYALCKKVLERSYNSFSQRC